MTPHHEHLILLTGGTGTSERRMADRRRAVADGVPAPVAEALSAMFESVLDGRNAHLGHGVQDALGHAPCDYSAFVARSATEGAWSAVIAQGAQ
jgi:hypothetical protein